MTDKFLLVAFKPYSEWRSRDGCEASYEAVLLQALGTSSDIIANRVAELIEAPLRHDEDGYEQITVYGTGFNTLFSLTGEYEDDPDFCKTVDAARDVIRIATQRKKLEDERAAKQLADAKEAAYKVRQEEGREIRERAEYARLHHLYGNR